MPRQNNSVEMMNSLLAIISSMSTWQPVVVMAVNGTFVTGIVTSITKESGGDKDRGFILKILNEEGTAEFYCNCR